MTSRLWSSALGWVWVLKMSIAAVSSERDVCISLMNALMFVSGMRMPSVVARSVHVSGRVRCMSSGVNRSPITPLDWETMRSV